MKNIIKELLSCFFSLFMNKEDPVDEISPAEIITRELDALWEMARRKGEGLYSEMECRDRIAESFNHVTEQVSNEQVDSAYTWPRYVKVSVHCVTEPVDELIAYVNEGNYILLSKHLSKLLHSVNKETEEQVKANMEKFCEAVCLHILKHVDSKDVPSFLALGRLHQKRAEYDAARIWFERITETEDPFNGVTALLACYEAETKAVLSNNKSRYVSDPELREKVKMLNERQCSVYEKWCGIAEERINGPDEVTEQSKREYVSLLTGYARFERIRGNYDKALMLLGKVPETYPDVFRVYTEEAMLYQCKPYRNRHYSLEKAIETFKKADAAVSADGPEVEHSIKSKKSILMPLANTYFQAGRYSEAKTVCERVLKLDSKEYRAVNLLARIARLAA